MNHSQFLSIRNSYFEYLQKFKKNNKLHPMQQLKRKHCIRVAQDSKYIAIDLGWDENNSHLAELCGLFHDIGRFSQFESFKTFYDPESLNHGEHGAQICIKENFLSECSESEKKIIINSIAFHNLKDIPPAVPDFVLPFLKLVRDADKLDIFYVINDAIANDRLNDYPEIVWRLDLQGPPNPKLIENINNKDSCNYTDVKSLTDFNLLQLSWVYNLNYFSTYKLIIKRNIINKIKNVIPDTPEINKLIAEAQKHVEKQLYINYNLSN